MYFFFLVYLNANIRHLSTGFASDGRVRGLVGVVPHGLFIPHKGETIGPPMIAANIIVCKSSEASMR